MKLRFFLLGFVFVVLLVGGSSAVEAAPPSSYAAVDDVDWVDVDGAVTIDITVNDRLRGAGTPTVQLMSAPGFGTATVETRFGLPVLIYRPAVGFAGVDTLSYEGCVGDDCSVAAVTVHVGSAECSITGSGLIEGTSGDDVICGSPGPDTIFGGGGGDIIIAYSGDDVIDGGDGDDLIVAGAGNDVVEGGDGDDVVYGGDGADQLGGGDGNDRINGNEGDDTIFGGKGEDTNNGGSGSDHLSGGRGEDVCQGAATADGCETIPTDLVAPALNVVTPDDGDVIDVSSTGTGTGYFSVTGTASDDGTISSITVYDGSETITAELTESGDGTVSFVAQVSGLASGPRSLTVTATDASGNETASVLAVTASPIPVDDTIFAPDYVAVTADLESAGFTLTLASTEPVVAGDLLVGETFAPVLEVGDIINIPPSDSFDSGGMFGIVAVGDGGYSVEQVSIFDAFTQIDLLIRFDTNASAALLAEESPAEGARAQAEAAPAESGCGNVQGGGWICNFDGDFGFPFAFDLELETEDDLVSGGIDFDGNMRVVYSIDLRGESKTNVRSIDMVAEAFLAGSGSARAEGEISWEREIEYADIPVWGRGVEFLGLKFKLGVDLEATIVPAALASAAATTNYTVDPNSAIGEGSLHWRGENPWSPTLDGALRLPTFSDVNAEGNAHFEVSLTPRIQVEGEVAFVGDLASATIGVGVPQRLIFDVSTPPLAITAAFQQCLNVFAIVDIVELLDDQYFTLAEKCRNAVTLLNIAYPGDMDGDGVGDDVDNCPLTPNSGQSDGDGDGDGNACDTTEANRVAKRYKPIGPGENDPSQAGDAATYCLINFPVGSVAPNLESYFGIVGEVGGDGYMVSGRHKAAHLCDLLPVYLPGDWNYKGFDLEAADPEKNHRQQTSDHIRRVLGMIDTPSPLPTGMLTNSDWHSLTRRHIDESPQQPYWASHSTFEVADDPTLPSDAGGLFRCAESGATCDEFPYRKTVEHEAVNIGTAVSSKYETVAAKVSFQKTEGDEFNYQGNDLVRLYAGTGCNRAPLKANDVEQLRPTGSFVVLPLPQSEGGYDDSQRTRYLCSGEQHNGADLPAAGDLDDDAVVNIDDNCTAIDNPDQLDTDGDGVGDACDEDITDTDGDGVPNADDNCRTTPNPDQSDFDGDGIGDACDDDSVDADRDGVIDDIDNCPLIPNPAQSDADADGLGDACDSTGLCSANYYTNTVLAANPIGYWKLDDPKGWNPAPVDFLRTNEVANGDWVLERGGHAVGTEPVVPAAGGYAANAYAADEPARVDALAGSTSLQTFTIETWLGADVLTDDPVSTWVSGQPVGAQVEFQGLIFEVESVGGQDQLIIGWFEPNVGRADLATVSLDAPRFHLAVVNGQDSVDVWVNGVFVASRPPFPPWLNSGGEYQVTMPGAWSEYGLSYDEVALYDRELTQTEMQAHLYAGIGPRGWEFPCGS